VATRSVEAGHAPFTMRVPFAPASVGLARKQLRSWMSEHGASTDQIEDARVIISELVGNSVRHARPLPDGMLAISWAADRDALSLAVTDGGGTTQPRRVNASSSALAGRGMAIVDSLARSWWVEDTRSRATVHAVLTIG
jgi:serine/threonine-protein kinase RsbW